MFEELFNYFNDVDKNYYEGEKMPVDILKEQNGYKLYANIPGYEKNEISIAFEEGHLIIKAKKEKKDSKENKELKENYLLMERNNKNKYRKIYFGNEVDENLIKAKYENGVLEVNLSFKAVEKKNKAIEIE